jgi:apolipoprotein N-acyltransferase
VTAIVCALASALAFFLALGTPNAWPLAWVAPVPLLWLALGHESWRRVALASLAGYAIGELGMLWPYVGAMRAALLVAALGPAVAFTLVVLATRFAARRLPILAATLAFPSLWTGFESLSVTLSPHGTFGAWAYSQLSAPVLIQSASLLGLWVVSFLIAYVASSIALAVRRLTLSPLVLPFALACVNAAFGMWRLHTPVGSTVRVAASARSHDDARSAAVVAVDEAAETRRLAALGTRIVVFDEKAALLPAERRDSALAPLVAAARETHTRIVAGFDETGAERRNAALTIGDDGRVTTYTKRHHIPGLESGYTIGNGPGLLGAGESVAICKDMDFQSTLRGDAAAGARTGSLSLMLVPAWDFDADGWLHARMAIMRGVEGGYAIVRAAANGLVTVSDARGRVLGAKPSGATTYASVVVDVPRGTGATTYVRIGDVFAWIAGLVGLALMAWSASRQGWLGMLRGGAKAAENRSRVGRD